jgi:hypothetical protein
MSVSFCVVILVSGEALDTIARKPGHDKAKGIRLALNGALEPCPWDRHCHVGDDQFAATGAF